MNSLIEMMAAGEIHEFPEHIIQHVQYFLTSKEAARTTILSKSWGSAWLARPNLDFDQRDFGYGDERWDPFPIFADKTLKRYEDSNLNIESFSLLIKDNWSYFDTDYDDGFISISKMIVRALKLRPTHLNITIPWDYLLPKEVFASENLVALTLKKCRIALERDWNVPCSRLQSLCLENVRVDRPDTLISIILSCPLIEKLSLCHVYNSSRDGVIGDGDPIILPRLRSLALEYVEFDTLFLSGLSSHFPSLKDLTLQKYMTSFKRDQVLLISSPSLERLHLKTVKKHTFRFKFDIPSIRKFSYEGEFIPSLNFRPTSRGRESHLVITRTKSLSISWFRRLSKLLTKLRRSRIHLSLHVYSRLSFDYKFGGLQGLPRHVIENLTIDFHYLPSLNCFALLDGLFLTCRPKLITPQNNIETLLQALDVKSSTPNQLMYGLKDLEEVNAQLFDADVSCWKDVSLDALLEKSTTPAKDIRDVRFQLKWQS